MAVCVFARSCAHLQTGFLDPGNVLEISNWKLPGSTFEREPTSASKVPAGNLLEHLLDLPQKCFKKNFLERSSGASFNLRLEILQICYLEAS